MVALIGAHSYLFILFFSGLTLQRRSFVLFEHPHAGLDKRTHAQAHTHKHTHTCRARFWHCSDDIDYLKTRTMNMTYSSPPFTEPCLAGTFCYLAGVSVGVRGVEMAHMMPAI